MLSQATTRKLAIVGVCAMVVSAQAQSPKAKEKPATKPATKVMHLDEAYFAGHPVRFRSPGTKSGHALVVGPWSVGEKVNPGNNDMRPNLYFVSPGTQYRLEGRPDFDHNEVLSAVPNEESNFDVYWVVVLDPSLQQDFTSEQQIILATQATFEVPDNLPFEQIPSAGFLRTFLKVKNIAALSRFKRPDGDLPRVAIVPAKITVRAVAEEMDHVEESQNPGDVKAQKR
jgi:hypothetical protein